MCALVATDEDSHTPKRLGKKVLQRVHAFGEGLKTLLGSGVWLLGTVTLKYEVNSNQWPDDVSLAHEIAGRRRHLGDDIFLDYIGEEWAWLAAPVQVRERDIQTLMGEHGIPKHLPVCFVWTPWAEVLLCNLSHIVLTVAVDPG